MKGQFFIIASIIMISAIILLVQYLFDFGKVDLSQLEERGSLDYIQSIKDSLIKTIQNSPCSLLEQELRESEAFIKSQMIKKGIVFEISHQIASCPTTHFNFTLRTSNSLTQTDFTYPWNSLLFSLNKVAAFLQSFLSNEVLSLIYLAKCFFLL